MMGSSFFSWIQRRGRHTASSNGRSVLASATASKDLNQVHSLETRDGPNAKRNGSDARQGILQMREHSNLLSMREQVLSSRIEEDTERARQELLRKNRDGAMLCLRRRARLESQLRATMAAREKIEEQMLAIECARNNIETAAALELGNGILRQIHKHLSIEQIDRIMLDMQEHTSKVDEITMALKQPIAPDIVDEAELERQMVELEFEVDEDRLIHDIPVQPVQRAQPVQRQTQTPVAQKAQTDRTLVELQSGPMLTVGLTDRIAAQLPKPPYSIQAPATFSMTTEPTASQNGLNSSVDRELQELAALTEPRV